MYKSMGYWHQGFFRQVLVSVLPILLQKVLVLVIEKLLESIVNNHAELQ